MNIRISALVVAAIMISAINIQTAYGIKNGAAPDINDYRYDAVCAFSYSHWLGLEVNNTYYHNWYGSGTLIAPDKVLIAKHLLPENYNPQPGIYAVRFRRKTNGSLAPRLLDYNDPAKVDLYHHEKIVSWIEAPPFPWGSMQERDVIIAVLENPVTHISPIKPWFDHDLDIGDTVTIAGWGDEIEPAFNRVRHELRLAERVIDKYPTRYLKTGVTAQGGDACNHDSGGAVVTVDQSGNLRLVGVIKASNLFENLGQFLGEREFLLPLFINFNDDGILDAEDIDLILKAVYSGSSELKYDVNSDNVIDSADTDYFIKVFMQVEYGDANIDGCTGLLDLDKLGPPFNQPGIFSWSEGDFNGDGSVGLLDLDLLGQSFGKGMNCSYTPLIYPGDANSDECVSVLDLDIIGQNFGMTQGAAWEHGDFNGDGKVTLIDLNLFGENFGKGDKCYDDY